jgi:hypothetical protein
MANPDAEGFRSGAEARFWLKRSAAQRDEQFLLDLLQWRESETVTLCAATAATGSRPRKMSA